MKLIDIDPKTGKFKLSRKVLLPKPEGMEQNDRQNAASAKIEANVKIADPDKIVEIVLIVTGGRDRKEKKIKNSI